MTQLRTLLSVTIGWIVTALGTGGPIALRGQDGIPHVREQGTAMQLIVDGAPFLMRGGELGNSTASDLEYLERFWPRFRALNLNTILGPVYWDRIEPAEGRRRVLSFQGAHGHGQAAGMFLGVISGATDQYAPQRAQRRQRRCVAWGRETPSGDTIPLHLEGDGHVHPDLHPHVPVPRRAEVHGVGDP